MPTPLDSAAPAIRELGLDPESVVSVTIGLDNWAAIVILPSGKFDVIAGYFTD